MHQPDAPETFLQRRLLSAMFWFGRPTCPTLHPLDTRVVDREWYAISSLYFVAVYQTGRGWEDACTAYYGLWD